MPDAEASWLHCWALISTIGASTRIENAVLTDAKIDWVDTALSQDGHVTAFDANQAIRLSSRLSRYKQHRLLLEQPSPCENIHGRDQVGN